MPTVLFPVRNAEATLDRALDSLWRQTWSDFEVLAVDDGSTDRSGDILAAHARRESRLRILPGGDGLVAALEAGRRFTRDPHLARMDADDICHPDRFRRQLAYLDEHPDVAAVGSRVAIFPRADVGAGWRRYETWLNALVTPEDHHREIFIESPLVHPSVMMRAAAVEAVGGYRETPWAEDYDLWLRLSAAGWGLAKVPATLLAWRHTMERYSLVSPKYSHGSFLAARAHYLARHPMLAAGSVAIWGAGRTGRRLTRRLRRHGVRVVDFYDVDPRKIGRDVEGARVRPWTDLARPGGIPVVVAVGSIGIRELIRPEVLRRGYREGEDVLFAA
jgi:glycosyltransferase involved in cell wall biosynthesis